MLRILTLITAFTPLAASANTVYKCQDGEQITFSQIPCQTHNTENEQLDYSQRQNSFPSSTSQTESAEIITNSTRYLLIKKFERSLSKIKTLKQKQKEEIEQIRNNGFLAGVNRAGSSYIKLLNVEYVKVRNKYQKSIDKERQTLNKIKLEMQKLDSDK